MSDNLSLVLRNNAGRDFATVVSNVGLASWVVVFLSSLVSGELLGPQTSWLFSFRRTAAFSAGKQSITVFTAFSLTSPKANDRVYLDRVL